MTRLEDLQPTAAVRGILRDQVVTVVSAQWFGSEALELRIHLRHGEPSWIDFPVCNFPKSAEPEVCGLTGIGNAAGHWLLSGKC